MSQSPEFLFDYVQSFFRDDVKIPDPRNKAIAYFDKHYGTDALRQEIEDLKKTIEKKKKEIDTLKKQMLVDLNGKSSSSHSTVSAEPSQNTVSSSEEKGVEPSLSASEDAIDSWKILRTFDENKSALEKQIAVDENQIQQKETEILSRQYAYRCDIFPLVNGRFDEYFKGLPSLQNSRALLEELGVGGALLGYYHSDSRKIIQSLSGSSKDPYHHFEWPFSYKKGAMLQEAMEAMLLFKQKVDQAWNDTEQYWSKLDEDKKDFFKKIIRNLVYMELSEPGLQFFHFYERAFNAFFQPSENGDIDPARIDDLREVMAILEVHGQTSESIILLVSNGRLSDLKKLKKDLLELIASSNGNLKDIEKHEIFEANKNFFVETELFSKQVKAMQGSKKAWFNPFTEIEDFFLVVSFFFACSMIIALLVCILTLLVCLIIAALYAAPVAVVLLSIDPVMILIVKAMAYLAIGTGASFLLHQLSSCFGGNYGKKLAETKKNDIKKCFLKYLPEEKAGDEEVEFASLKTTTEQSFLIFEKFINREFIVGSVGKWQIWQALVVWLSEGKDKFNSERLQTFNNIAKDLAAIKDNDWIYYPYAILELERQIVEHQLDYLAFKEAIEAIKEQFKSNDDLVREFEIDEKTDPVPASTKDDLDQDRQSYKKTDLFQLFATKHANSSFAGKPVVYNRAVHDGLDLAVCQNLSTGLLDLHKKQAENKKQNIASNFKIGSSVR